MSDVVVQWNDLQEFTSTVFAHAGMSEDDAALEAEVLVWANLRGIDSHGVLRVDNYLDKVDTGSYKVRPEIRVLKETPATLLIECDQCFGPIATTMAMEKAIDKARTVGIGWASLRNHGHQGAMAYYTHMATAKGMAGMTVCTNPPNMVPPGARTAATHNSPLSIAVPANRHPPISLDMATSIVAGGKLEYARDQRMELPDDWAFDESGEPTTDPFKATFLRPAGGYKGYGMALLFECLTGVLVGNPILVPWIRELQPKPLQGVQNSFVCAIDVDTFTDQDDYRQHIDDLIDTMHATPVQEGSDPIQVPGERENAVCEQRTRDGIPLPEGTVNKLIVAADRFGIELPW